MEPTKSEMFDPKASAVVAQPSAPAPRTMLDIIADAVRDPSVDPEKLRQLMELAAEAEARQAARDYDAAMAKAQEEMQPVRADASNPHTSSKYATFLALDRALRPIYTKHGFSLSFDTEPSTLPDHVRVVCHISRGGHKQRAQVDMPTDGKGAKGGEVMTKTHAMGAGLTYGQRYLLKLIFNIAVGRDDDGNSGPRDLLPETMTLLEDVNGLESDADFASWPNKNKEAVDKLPQSQADLVVKTFNVRFEKHKAKKKGGRGAQDT